MKWPALLLIALSTVGLAHAAALVGLQPLPYPDWAEASGQQGIVDVVLAFDHEGRVASIRVKQCTAPRPLADYTCDFIKKNWRNLALAGQRGEIPIHFVLSGAVGESWTHDFSEPMVSFPGKAAPLTLSASFDVAGRVVKCSVADSSGDPGFDNSVVRWALARWHHVPYAGLSVELTIATKRTSPFQVVIWRSG